MSLRSRLDAEKGVEVLLYVSERCPDTYTALKVLYFADKDHLSKYGRQLYGDSYVAMKHGPVPSWAYDLVKYARGDGFCWVDIPISDTFTVQGNDIIPRRGADLESLSESDVECLDAAITRYAHLSFGKLKRLSHDSAYDSVGENDFIPFEAVVKTLSDADLILEYLRGN